jgi:hypothetical protein
MAIRKTPNGSIELSCRTEVGRQYRLQASSDGRVWCGHGEFSRRKHRLDLPVG